ncbi:hypothetical protein SAMN06297129_0128 [Pseudooceanicola antarcticus]|uniref:Protease inhibitor Inh n=1 Tax=Pseudooceanicola antarcticus TaxID=1247613 RepID=A0A285HK59_9RHOB|nr:hypothetical protein [Pseudooceanicola antarcticus]SNY36119.1 hypothetical protein SAMN06297129_0128 [Pseudooceanicola antarcticus]
MKTSGLSAALCVVLSLGPQLAWAQSHVRLEMGPWVVSGDWRGDGGDFLCTAFSSFDGPTLAIRQGTEGLILSTDSYSGDEVDQQVSVDGTLYPITLGGEEWDWEIEGGAAFQAALEGASWIDLHPDWEGGSGIFRLTDLPAIRKGLAECAEAADFPTYEADLTEVPLLGENCPDPASVQVTPESWTFFRLRNESAAPVLIYQLIGEDWVVWHGGLKGEMVLEGAPGEVYLATDMQGRCLSGPKVVPEVEAPAMGSEDDPGPLLVFP